MSRPLVVLWRTTTACDLACPFCAYARDVPQPRLAVAREPVLAFGQVLRDWAQAEQRPVLVSWLGGEPLYWPPVFEISRVFQHELGLRVSATTNGTALRAARVREQVVENFAELTLSLDGADAFHDQIRRTPGLLAQLRRDVAALSTLNAQRGSPLKLRVNTVLLRDNYAQFPALCALACELGATELTFNALGGRDRPEFYPAHHLLPEQLADLARTLPALRARFAPLGLHLLGSAAYVERLQSAINNQQSPITNCSPGTSFLFIDEHHRVAPCSFTTTGYGLPLAEISDLAALRALPARFAAQQRAHLQPSCYDCPSTQVFGKFGE